MRRVASLASSSKGALATAVASFASTKKCNQVQHQHVITKSHGAGLINHESKYKKDINAAPAADLASTPLDKGLGTNAQDPYNRTLPNLDMIPPESTVLTASRTAPTITEVQSLKKRSGTLGYWFGGQHPRMMHLLNSEKVAAPSVPASGEVLLNEFKSVAVLGALCQGVEPPLDLVATTRAWDAIENRFASMSLRLLDKKGFELDLDRNIKAGLLLFGETSVPPEELKAAVEILRRKAVKRRNDKIANLMSLCSDEVLVGNGDAVLERVLNAVRNACNDSSLPPEARFFNPSTDDSVKFLWENLVENPTVSACSSPAVTAPVALFFSIVSASLALAQPEVAVSKAATNFRSVPLIERRKFVKSLLMDLAAKNLLVTSEMTESLRLAGLKEDSALMAIIGASMAVQAKERAEQIKAMSLFFQDEPQVRLVFQRLSGKGAEVKSALYKVLHLDEKTVPVLELTKRSSWPTRFMIHMDRILSSDILTNAIVEVIEGDMRNLQNKNMSAHATLFSTEKLEALRKFNSDVKAHMEVTTARVRNVVESLYSSEKVDKTIEALQLCQVDLAELHEIRDKRIASLQKPKQPEIDLDVFSNIVNSVAERHANWKSANVLPPTAPAEPSSLDTLKMASRIYLRSVYVPNAAVAAIAAATRRRIGPIGTESHEFNIPIEVGQTEKYDNLLHKRYDWQGWFQRMVDIHNRNISMRCKLHELRTLDHQGRPFFDMQSERRLRIVAKERVGMGIIKLDSDKFEDQSDNLVHGSTKLSQLLADARKTHLGAEYVPTVEVKVRRPSGQSKMHYSLLDFDRVEKKSEQLFVLYKEAKKKSFFVSPKDTWLQVKGLQVRKTADAADADGYTVDNLFDTLDKDKDGK